uniref:TIMELESS-interacting protein n=1 Tax=Caenorhabditis tropicalis TaxID=1561998 RepID=A0A1I7ULE6_9PELO
MDEMDDFFGNDEFDREPSPIGEEAIEDNRGEEGSRKVIEPKLLRTKKLTNPRLALNESTLTSSKGLPALREVFKTFKPNPKDNPYSNLDKMMKKYAYWGHLMFPKLKTEDVLNRVETLGTRRQVKVYLMKQRLGESTDELEQENKKRRRTELLMTEQMTKNHKMNCSTTYQKKNILRKLKLKNWTPQPKLMHRLILMMKKNIE